MIFFLFHIIAPKLLLVYPKAPRVSCVVGKSESSTNCMHTIYDIHICIELWLCAFRIQFSCTLVYPPLYCIARSARFINVDTQTHRNQYTNAISHAHSYDLLVINKTATAAVVGSGYGRGVARQRCDSKTPYKILIKSNRLKWILTRVEEYFGVTCNPAHPRSINGVLYCAVAVQWWNDDEILIIHFPSSIALEMRVRVLHLMSLLLSNWRWMIWTMGNKLLPKVDLQVAHTNLRLIYVNFSIPNTAVAATAAYVRLARARTRYNWHLSIIHFDFSWIIENEILVGH